MVKLLCLLCAFCTAGTSRAEPVIQPLMSLKGDGQPVLSVAFSRNGTILASGGCDNSVSLWDVKTGKKLAILKGHFVAVSALSFAPDGKTLASASYDGTVKLWDISTSKNTRTLKAHCNVLYALAISPDGKTIAASGFERYIDLWNARTFENVGTYDDKFVTSLVFSPDGKNLISGNGKAEFRIWDLANGKVIRRSKTRGEGGMIHSLAISRDGKELACEGDDDHFVSFWNCNWTFAN